MIDEPQGESITVIPFKLWPAQAATLWHFLQRRLFIILKARQLGISWLCCAYALWQCMYQPGRRVLLFSRGQREADELLRRVTAMYSRLPEWMRDHSPYARDPNTTSAEWLNGSMVESLPATQNAGRSLTASLVIADEFAFMQWGDKLYTALKPTIDGGGQLIVVSTANGARGLFHALWVKAYARLNAFLPIFLNWRMRPGRDDAWYQQVASEAVSSALMMQEYPSTPEEAFSATDAEKFLPSMIWWDALRVDVPALDRYTPIVLAADAGVNNDSFGVTGCSRHWEVERAVANRYTREWKPGRYTPIDFSDVEAEIRRLCAEFNVIEFTYDPYQLYDMASRLQRDGIVKTKQFNQGADRLESDKQFLDLIMQKRYFHDGNPDLRAHVDHADKKVDTETRKLRIIKRQEDLKIDLAVSTAMGAYRCLKLPL
jgi:hypothetical protein